MRLTSRFNHIFTLVQMTFLESNMALKPRFEFDIVVNGCRRDACCERRRFRGDGVRENSDTA